MTKEELQNLCRHKLNITSANEPESDIVDSVLGDKLVDFCKRYPWSFLTKRKTDVTIAAGDTTEKLPPEFSQFISGEIKDSDNILYPMHSVKPKVYGERNPDLDDTGRPYEYWAYYDAGRDWYIEFRPKSDASYTGYFWYLEKLSIGNIDVIPDGTVLFKGVMAVMASSNEMSMWETRYENAIAAAWLSDNPDLGNEPEWGQDRQIKAYNEFTAGL